MELDTVPSRGKGGSDKVFSSHFCFKDATTTLCSSSILKAKLRKLALTRTSDPNRPTRRVLILNDPRALLKVNFH